MKSSLVILGCREDERRRCPHLVGWNGTCGGGPYTRSAVTVGKVGGLRSIVRETP
jgi:hypothetical protein